MKVRYKEIKFSFCGDIHSFYVKEYKHWWNLWWHIEMDGYVPAQYDLIDGEFIRKIQLWNSTYQNPLQ